MSIGKIKTYSICISVAIFIYLFYSFYEKGPNQNKQEVVEEKKGFKKTKQFQYTPGVTLQKKSPYHNEKPLNNLNLGLNGNSQMTTINGSKYNLRNNLKNVEISLSNASTPKKTVEVLSITPINGYSKKVDTNNILEGLDGISLELSEKENVKSDFKSKIHAIVNKEGSKNEDKNCDETLSLDSERIAENVAMNVIGGNELNENASNTALNIKFNNVPNTGFFPPYNGWAPPIQFHGNRISANVNNMNNLNNMNNMTTMNNNLLQPMMPMSPISPMHHLNQLNQLNQFNGTGLLNQCGPIMGGKSPPLPRPNIW